MLHPFVTSFVANSHTPIAVAVLLNPSSLHASSTYDLVGLLPSFVNKIDVTVIGCLYVLAAHRGPILNLEFDKSHIYQPGSNVCHAIHKGQKKKQQRNDAQTRDTCITVTTQNDLVASLDHNTEYVEQNVNSALTLWHS